MKNISLFCLFLLACAFTARAQQRVTSPDGKLTVTVTTDGDGLMWQIDHSGTAVLQPSAIALQGRDARSANKTFRFGRNVQVQKVDRASVDTSFPTPFYKKASVTDRYNRMTLICAGGYSVEFRAYDDGAAYRFAYTGRRPLLVTEETADFNFAEDHRTFVPYVNDNRAGERYCYSFESYYDEARLSEMFRDSLAITPLLADLGCGKKAVVMEAGQENYPGMYLVLNETTRQGLQARFAPYPLETEIGGYNRLNLIPTRRADYIARIDGPRTLPWRVVLVTERDTQLADNDMAQRLAPACRIADTSWIRPGKVAWDWWNTTNLTGVDFRAGMNTPTYKYFIDFASRNSLEYIIIDEGWSGEESLMELSPVIDLKELVAYGKEKGVGIILWSTWRNAIKEMDATFAHYADMGIKGFKVDFFDRDDQEVIASVEELAACAARHHLLLDLHGLKPYGVQRAYPNIVNFEGVKGLENAKWEPVVNGAPLHDFPRYDVTAPYLRMLTGPMDYTPGAMQNATRQDFRANNDHPMSQGTRVHQMAMYTLFEAPLQMLADSPTRYEHEQECTDFIASVPTVFDETVALFGEVGESIALARRKGDTWYVAALTNWTPRDCTIDLSFLTAGSDYEAVIFYDGINADRDATDYIRREVNSLTAADRLSVHLAPGGGWTARIVKK